MVEVEVISILLEMELWRRASRVNQSLSIWRTRGLSRWETDKKAHIGFMG